jgi:hypothetical protein
MMSKEDESPLVYVIHLTGIGTYLSAMFCGGRADTIVCCL